MKSVPCESQRITSYYGERKHPVTGTHSFHKGVDFGQHEKNHEPIFSTDDGVVIISKYSATAGEYVRIQHDTYMSEYMHLDRRYVSLGDEVQAGQVIGTMGTTGSSTGIHLHFGILQGSSYLNPLPFLEELWNRPQEEEEVRYQNLSDIPEWYRPTIEKLIEKGIITGGSDDGDDTNDLNLSDDMCRIFVANDRARLYE